MNCTKCGKEMRIAPEQVTVDEKGLPVYHRMGYCDACMIKMDIDIVENKQKMADQLAKPTKMKQSTLSTLAALFSLLTITIPVAIVLAIIDLVDVSNKYTKKHTGSWFAIIWGIIIIFVFIGTNNSSGSSDNNTLASASTVSSQEYTTGSSVENDISPTNAPDSENKFTYNNMTVEYLDYEIVENIADETVIVIYYNFTNNTSENKTFDTSFTDTCFQNGVEIEHSLWHANEESKNSNKEIKPGITLTVSSSFVLSSETDVVSLEITPWISLSDKVIFSKDIDINN